jgi:hypothetical protein
MEPFGGPIRTAALRRLADSGLTYANFHTTALCSPISSESLEEVPEVGEVDAPVIPRGDDDPQLGRDDLE